LPRAEIGRYASAQRGRTGAFVAGQFVGLLSTAASAILNPIVVLPALIIGFTESWYLIALPVVLAGLLWGVGAGIGGLSAGRERPVIWAIAGNIVRLLVVIALAFVVDRSEQYSDDAMLRALFVCFGIYVVGSGLASQAGVSVATRMIPAGRRTSYFASRTVLGALAAIAVALVAAAIFADDSIVFPAQYAVLFVIAAACLAVATYFQSTIRSPANVTVPSRPIATAATRPGRGLITYVGFRWFLAASALADPFLIVYALRDLSASPAVIGLYVAALVACRLLSEPMWTRLARRGRIRAGLQAVAVIRLLVPVLALTLPQLYEATVWTDRVTDPDTRGWVFALVFALIGIAQGGQARLNLPYLTEIEARHGAIARPLTNGIVAIAALAPLAGAWVYTRWGFDETLLSAGGVALLGVLLSGALVVSSGVARPVGNSWQFRRQREAVSLTGRRD